MSEGRDAPGTTATPRLLADATADLLAWHRETRRAADGAFPAMQEVVTRLGAHWRGSHAEFGFWTPEAVREGVPESDVALELLTPTDPVDLSGDRTEVTFERTRVPVRREGDFHWAAVEGVRPGSRERVGTLYRLVVEADGETRVVHDPVAYSVPFGPFAPAELYDVEALDADRPDRHYFEALGTAGERVSTSDHRGLPRVDPATSMLEIHPGTATREGTLGALADRYERIGEKLREGADLTPAEENFVGYDAVQVMPVEPLTENPERHDFWSVVEEGAGSDGTGGDGTEAVTVACGRPQLINWGYDIVVSAFSAPNPAILGSGRPDELVDFIAACHDLPRPIKVVFDVALGHADDRGAELLPEDFFEGPGMYGKHLDYRHPVARALVLELQRRKMDFGADGIRVDGAQDFTYYDPDREENVHDDEFLARMDEVTQEVAGTEYRPWMIYEDGRPWPRGDWELASTYRELIKQHPHSFQWSPITFAHNKPALLTFWATKWWRVREVIETGSDWITGVANHDTLRRGTQQPVPEGWEQDPINPHLGETPPEIIDEAYDSPAAVALMHCALPGVPMDFLNANFRSPWGFVRDTDPEWNVKVVADEANFVQWHVTGELFADDRFFSGLKDLGFTSADELDAFVHALKDATDATDYDLETMATVLAALEHPFEGDVTPADLEAFARAWMADVYEFANLSHWVDDQDPVRTAFDRAAREFRHDRPWLIRDVGEGEAITYRHPADGTVCYYGLRVSPDGDERVLFAANMEGTPVDVSVDWLAEELAAEAGEVPREGWSVALSAPGLPEEGRAFELDNAEAVVWTRSG
jgi:hypothetical protein